MKYNVSFQDRAKLGMAQISKQPSVTLEQAKNQALWIKQTSTSSAKKQRDSEDTFLFSVKEHNH